MAASGQWNVALLETDKPRFNEWLARCREVGTATNMADAIRWAVQLATIAHDRAQERET